MFVPIKEHDSQWIIQLVHSIEIWYFSDIHYVENYEFAQLIADLTDDLIHLHALRVPIMPESNHHQLFTLC